MFLSRRCYLDREKITGKIVGFTSRCKRCRKCSIAKSKKKKVAKHTCKKNWTVSAKSMEPDMIVEIIKDAKEKNNPVVTLIGDDDCTAIHRARCEISSTIQKVSDTNHVKKKYSVVAIHGAERKSLAA